MSDPTAMSAIALRDAIAHRELSAREVATAHLARIDALDGVLNAVPTRCPELALAQAHELDEHLARTGEVVGPLHGLPVVHKDLAETAGVRTTYGSPAFANYVPTFDALVVARMKAAGTVMLGKSNVPEMGAGSHTFNPVFGTTRNPWDVNRTCGGSSGGAAVAVATGMAALADGSDLGGSLRNPPAFCGVVGMRPSIGRVPEIGPLATRARLGVAGPIARTVADTALLLATLAGPHPHAPSSLADPGTAFAPPLEPIGERLRVAVSADLGDLPIDPAIRHAFATFVPVLDRLGWLVEPAVPPLEGVDRVFETIRAWYTASRMAPLSPEQRAMVKTVIQAERAAGEALRALDLATAFAAETRLVQQAADFFDDHDLLLCPTTQVPPFAIEHEYVTEIDGQAMASYIEWMRICSRLSVLGIPAISIPIGFTASGLPVGVQVAGRHGADRFVMRAAAMIEAALGPTPRPATAGR